jgi:hypothetical protein
MKEKKEGEKTVHWHHFRFISGLHPKIGDEKKKTYTCAQRDISQQQ